MPRPSDSPIHASTKIESKVVTRRLNQIDKVRAHGVGDHIDLPQLVVCGDQSAGKSSVLEGIAGIPFPRKDGLCTKFATEIILRHTLGDLSIMASTLPHASRDKEERGKLEGFSRRLSGYDELPDVIEQVPRLMGLRVSGDDTSSSTFSADVLRIEVTGKTGLQLTMVDLPGLIEGSQDGVNRALVNDLVDFYMKASRTIILAVIPAGSDIETQSIIRRAFRFDKHGQTTVGIIKKPHLINRESQRLPCSLRIAGRRS